ncbi:hypothetical protein B0H13DRAFT_356839 [Mycena leptocephala]|nr:hypothetical protein B0H13DRAFT_356839 [Mycena leptocephala]
MLPQVTASRSLRCGSRSLPAAQTPRICGSKALTHLPYHTWSGPLSRRLKFSSNGSLRGRICERSQLHPSRRRQCESCVWQGEVGRVLARARSPSIPTPLLPPHPRPYASPAARNSPQHVYGVWRCPATYPIVGRGGVGSRPRGLLFSEQQHASIRDATIGSSHTATAPTNRIDDQERRAPAVYRPSGRGGAGSRPRKVKPQSEEKEKEFKFPWKGKGKAKVDLSASALTRTDTRFSEISSIAFAPPETQRHQKPINPDPLMPSNTSFTSIDSWDAHLAHQQSNRINKLARTLGADFSFPGKINSNGPHGPLDAQAAKLARRSSISVPSTPLDDIASHSSRRQSSYGSLVQPAQNDSASSTHSSDHRREVWDLSEHQPSPYIYGARNITDSPTQGYYPAPPRPPQAYPDAPEYDEDDDYLEDEDEVSEILSLSQSDDPRFSLNSQSSGEVHVQPPFEIEETDSEYGRAQTPTRFAPYSDSRGETPLPDDKQRFESPFQTMPLFVLPWEPTHRPSGPAADELANEWSGEWNQKDMQSVIRSLRTLKFSGD